MLPYRINPYAGFSCDGLTLTMPLPRIRTRCVSVSKRERGSQISTISTMYFSTFEIVRMNTVFPFLPVSACCVAVDELYIMSYLFVRPGIIEIFYR